MPPPGAKLAPTSGLDKMLAAVSGGVSAPPTASPSLPAAPKAVLAADTPPVTTQNGMAGVMAALNAAGGMSPKEYAGAADKIIGQVQAAAQPAIQSIEQNIGARKAIMAQPIARPAPPQLQGMPQAPDTRIHNPLQVFSQSGAILAMLGSIFTRRPLVTAMNAAAAAIKGYADGDKDAAERAHKDWKDHLEAAIAQNQAEMDQYNVLLEDTKISQEERTAQLAALSASNNDQNMLAALRSGAPDMMFKVLDGRQKSAESLVGILTQAQQHDDQVAMERARLAETERHNRSIEGSGVGMDSDTIDMIAQQYLSGDRTALQGLGYGKAGAALRAQVLQRASSIAQGQGGTPDIALNRATYSADAKTLSQMQNYISRADTFQSVFLKNIQQVNKYSAAGVAGEIPVINKWIQAGRRATGDKDVAAFDAAIKTASREYARIMSGPTSNAQLTVSAQQNADEMLSSAMNAEQLQAVITVMQQDIQNSIQSASETMDAIRSSISANGNQGESGPKIGDIQDGYRFRGGDPADKDNWEAVH